MKPARRIVSGWDDSRTPPPPPNWRAPALLAVAVLLVVLALTVLRPLVRAWLLWWLS